MYKYIFLFVAISTLVLPLADSHAQMSTAKTTRILFLLDGSSSMIEPWSADATRFQAAAHILTTMADSIQRLNPEVEFGLRVFGHEHGVLERNCYDTKLEVPFIKLAADQLRTRLRYLHPQGVSPIAYSLQEAATNDFMRDNRYAYSIILLTDGGESCGGDICTTMQQLINKRISFTPYIISLLDYAPMAKSYECMGSYMVVKTDTDVARTIRTIIADNNSFKADEHTRYIPPTSKPVVAIPEPSVPIAAPPSTPAPALLVDTIAAPRRQYIPRLAASNYVRAGYSYWRYSTNPIPIPPMVLVPFVVAPEAIAVPRSSVALSRITSGGISPLPYQNRRIAARTIAIPNLGYIPMVVVPEPPVHTPLAIERISPIKGGYIRQNSLLVLTDKDYVVMRPLPFTNFPIETPAATPKVPEEGLANVPTVVPNTPTPAADGKGTFQLYFSNGNGKYYSTEPDIIIKDQQGKQAYRGFRDVVGRDGAPKPIPLAAGKYTVSIVGNSARNTSFSIAADQNTRAEIIVTRGTLSFGYEDKSKPQGYFALVSKRFEPGPIIKQPTEQELNYEPANYHVEVNTLPPSLFNIDLVFDIGNMITLAKPGKVQIMNTDELGRIQFWYQLGDRYVPFYDMNIYGDIENQVADFKPGPYQVRYNGKDGQGNDVIRIMSFQIRKDQTTELTLTQ